MKKRISILAIILLGFITSQGQHFDWASSGSGMHTGMQFGVVTTNGSLITGMNYEQPSYYPMNQMPVMYDSNGDSIALGMIASQMIIYKYDKSGKIDWTLQGDLFTGDSRLLGIAPRKNGNVVIAYTANEVAGKVELQPVPEALKDDASPGKTNSAPQSDSSEYDDETYNGRSTSTGYSVIFSEIDADGRVVSSIAMMGINGYSWSDFKSAPDGGVVIALDKQIKTTDVSGKFRDVAHHITLKLDMNYKFVWAHKVMYLDNSCCSSFIPQMAMTVADNGEVFIAGNVRFGVRLQGAKDHMAPILDEVTQYNQPYDSYVARLDVNGKLKWVKYTNAKSIIEDIAVDDKNVYFCGVIRLSDNLLGMPMDTADRKLAFLACLDIAGKSKWVKNYSVNTIKTLNTDGLGNLTALFQSKSTQYDKPVIIGSDTLTNSYADLIVVSYSKEGKEKWTKTSNVMMHDGSESFPVLTNDDCGNIYVIAEMWYVLPSSFSIFDAALVRGVGYGGAPLVARIRTTLPSSIEELNPQLLSGLDIKLPDPSGGGENENGNCIAIPSPWKLDVLPNPTTGIFTARATLSYSDRNVRLELWDAKGNFVRILSQPELLPAGLKNYECDISELSGGLYILLLKGEGSAVSTRVILTN